MNKIIYALFGRKLNGFSSIIFYQIVPEIFFANKNIEAWYRAE
jgi:hypothetical protein